MAVLNEKAILELIVDSAQGVETLEDFQGKFDKGFNEMAASATDAETEVIHVTEAVVDAAVEVDELGDTAATTGTELEGMARGAATGTKDVRAFADVIGLLDPRLATLLRQGARATEGVDKLSKGAKGAATGLDTTTVAATGTAVALGKLLGVVGLVVTAFKLAYDGTREVVEQLEKMGVNVDDLVSKMKAVQDFGDVFGNFKLTLDEVQESGGLLNAVFDEMARARADAKDQTDQLTAAFWEQDAALRANAQAAKEAAEAAKEAAKDEEERWAFLGESLDETIAEYDEATEATVDNTKAVEKSVPAYRKAGDALQAMTSIIRDHVQALRESIRQQREAAGIDDREESVAGLRQEIEALEAAEIRTIEQENRLDDAKGELIRSERELRDALADTNLFYDEHNLAVDEATLAALEAEQQQQRLAEALGLTTESQGELGEATDEAALAFQEQKEQADAVAEGVSGIAAAVKVADPVVMGFLAKMNAELRVSIGLLQDAKQCAIDLGAGMDQV